MIMYMAQVLRWRKLQNGLQNKANTKEWHSTENEKSDSMTQGRILLGVTPLDFGPQKNVESTERKSARIWLECIIYLGNGRYLWKRCKWQERRMSIWWYLQWDCGQQRCFRKNLEQPYVIGTPNEWLAEDYFKEALENVAEQQMEQLSNTQYLNRLSGMQKCDGTKVKDQLFRAFIPEAVYLKDRMQTSAEITLIGEPVTMGSLAAGIEKVYGRSARVFCPLKECENLVGEKDAIILGEEAMEKALKEAKIIVADPLYRPIAPKDCEFYELPHVAFSGRMFLTQILTK